MAAKPPPTAAVQAIWSARWPSAARRRVRHWRRLWHDERYPDAAQRAGAWLTQSLRADDRSSLTPVLGDPSMAADVLHAAIAFGLADVAERASEALLAVQRADGSLPSVAGGGSARCATGRGLAAWLAELAELESQFSRGPMVVSRRNAIAEAARRAAEYLFDAIDAAGRVRPVVAGETSDQIAEATVWLAALFQAGSVLHAPDWHWAAQHAVDRLERTCDVTTPGGGTQRLARIAEALLDLGRDERAGRALSLARAWQQPSGGMRLAWRLPAASPAEVAQWARLWFRAGQLEPADRAMAWLARGQHADGGWSSAWRRQDGADSLAAVAGYLRAAQAQVAAHFHQHPDTAPAQRLADDPRRQFIRRWLEQLPYGARVADIGCGRGPYFGEAGHRGLRWYGVDPLPEHLEQLPAGVERRRGSMLCLPLADGAMDAVLAIESLEHALDPARAVVELCRVLRPGGQLLIVDKDRRRQDLSDHAPWERWFVPSEIADWLRGLCDVVRAEPISILKAANNPAEEGGHSPRRFFGSFLAEGAGAPGVFIAWTAVRRAAASVPMPTSADDDRRGLADAPQRRRAA